VKCESTWIEFKKNHQLTKYISYQIPTFVEPLAIMENMASGFDWVKSAQTIKFFSWKKP